jgi:hypothetical protein
MPSVFPVDIAALLPYLMLRGKATGDDLHETHNSGAGFGDDH